MRKLWLFGDSYGIPLNRNINWWWPLQVAKTLNCQLILNKCVLGAANDYTQYMIMENQKLISSNDIVIVFSTSIDRKWFFKDHPYAGNFFCSNLEELVGTDKSIAVKEYVTHLMNNEAIYINFHQFLGWIHYITDKNHWNLLVISGFEEKGYPISHKYEVEGSLYDVCQNEFFSDNDRNWYYSVYCKGRDKRAGHLTKNNHDVLAKKVYETFKFSKKLDLNTEFHQKVISKNNINSIQDQFVEIQNLKN
jgi:hypothetical protein